MSNVMKYWLLLESLNLPGISRTAQFKNENDRVLENITLIQKSLSLCPEEIVGSIVANLQSNHLKHRENEIAKNMSIDAKYSMYSLLIVQTIGKSVNLLSDAVEDLISENHKTLFIALLEDIVDKGVKPNLHPGFYKSKGSIFCRNAESQTNFYRAELIVEVLSSIIHKPTLRMSEDIFLCYMAAIFSILLACDAKEYTVEQNCLAALQSKLNKIWTDMPKVLYYRNLMLLYGILPAEQKPRIHKEMLLKLWSNGGFVALLFALQKSEKTEEQPISQVVEKLVAQPSYPRRAQESLVQQILRFLATSVDNKDLGVHMGAALVSLRRLYDNNDENKELVKKWLKGQLQPLLEFHEDRITVMEWNEFCTRISLLFHMFCTSTVECMPSELLTAYLPVLVACHQEVCECTEKSFTMAVSNHLAQLILRILNNRGKEELRGIIKSFVLAQYPLEWLHKHANVIIDNDPLQLESLRIVQKDMESETNSLFSGHMNTLAIILKESSFSLLCYQVFITLFGLFTNLPKQSSEEVNANDDLLQTEEDVENKIVRDITQKYNGKIQIINALQILITHKPLKILLMENIKDVLIVLQDMLALYAVETDDDIDSSVMTILLTLMGEILENATDVMEDVKMELHKHLSKLEPKVLNPKLKFQISCLRKQIQGPTNINHTSKERFEEARLLLESPEPYMQVEGIQKFIQLIKEKDTFTLNSVHVVSALALNTLKSTESYTFLNCVRLFAALVYVDEHTIMEILCDDYLNDSAATDYRLVVGEALLKVCKEIGQLCYRYKGLLLNTYMSGCRSPLDEFRYSSFSNLAQLCKILSFEVHQYFEELLQLINCELSTGKYMPAKRAAVMVLSDLLAAMDNLLDYQDMLLPIYRLLKLLASTESADEKIRLHAAIGLENLSVKCKELLTAIGQPQLQKEIKITGIKDKEKKKLNNHILYMN
uniref:RNA polymerase II assembly factor Rtp1 C-terminal domain-containing protein n=2 Tax=Stomoxys calcitrans TaxID=35570 RepID=A0A1I8NTW4_STOCA